MNKVDVNISWGVLGVKGGKVTRAAELYHTSHEANLPHTPEKHIEVEKIA